MLDRRRKFQENKPSRISRQVFIVYLHHHTISSDGFEITYPFCCRRSSDAGKSWNNCSWSIGVERTCECVNKYSFIEWTRSVFFFSFFLFVLKDCVCALSFHHPSWIIIADLTFFLSTVKRIFDTNLYS